MKKSLFLIILCFLLFGCTSLVPLGLSMSLGDYNLEVEKSDKLIDNYTRYRVEIFRKLESGDIYTANLGKLIYENGEFVYFFNINYRYHFTFGGFRDSILDGEVTLKVDDQIIKIVDENPSRDIDSYSNTVTERLTALLPPADYEKLINAKTIQFDFSHGVETISENGLSYIKRFAEDTKNNNI